MKQEIYINQILKLVIKSWLEASYYFILEEDNNLDYDMEKLNIIYI